MRNCKALITKQQLIIINIKKVINDIFYLSESNYTFEIKFKKLTSDLNLIYLFEKFKVQSDGN